MRRGSSVNWNGLVVLRLGSILKGTILNVMDTIGWRKLKTGKLVKFMTSNVRNPSGLCVLKERIILTTPPPLILPRLKKNMMKLRRRLQKGGKLKWKSWRPNARKRRQSFEIMYVQRTSNWNVTGNLNFVTYSNW